MKKIWNSFGAGTTALPSPLVSPSGFGLQIIHLICSHKCYLTKAFGHTLCTTRSFERILYCRLCEIPADRCSLPVPKVDNYWRRSGFRNCGLGRLPLVSQIVRMSSEPLRNNLIEFAQIIKFIMSKGKMKHLSNGW
jgi:hypothetical protein